jgi:hypothetical protein
MESFPKYDDYEVMPGKVQEKKWSGHFFATAIVMNSHL